MPRFPRRHIPNPAKPPVFRQPPNLDVHMVSAVRVDGHHIRITMSGPIQSGFSSSSFYFGESGNGIFWNGDLSTISGGPFITFDISFAAEMATETACDNAGFVVCNLDPDYAVAQGMKLRAPDAIAYAGL